jgi:hypothetical protein
MKTKHILVIFTFILFFLANSLKAQTVYVTESGKKYHAKNCSIVKNGKKGIDLAEAKKQGFEPCKSCKSEEEPKAADKPKEKKEGGKGKK